MDEKTPQTTEAAHQELAALHAEIETLRAKKSIAECIRETISVGLPIKPLKRKVRKSKGRTGAPIVEVTLLETDYQQLVKMAHSAEWITRKLAELQHLGDKLWHKVNQSAILQEAIQRAEVAEMRCRSLEQQLSQARTQTVYNLDDGADREIDPFTWDDREID